MSHHCSIFLKEKKNKYGCKSEFSQRLGVDQHIDESYDKNKILLTLNLSFTEWQVLSHVVFGQDNKKRINLFTSKRIQQEKIQNCLDVFLLQIAATCANGTSRDNVLNSRYPTIHDFPSSFSSLSPPVLYLTSTCQLKSERAKRK